YRVRSSDRGYRHPSQPMAFYRGIMSGQDSSIAAVSLFRNEVRIMYSGSKGNFRVHKVRDDQYVLYSDRDIREVQPLTCGVSDKDIVPLPDEQITQRSVSSGNCVQIYFECDYECYLDNGSSVSNTEAWVAALFHEVATLYANEDIPVFISDILVWTSPDPYRNLNSTSAMLNKFVDQIEINGYDGRLAHLLSTRN